MDFDSVFTNRQGKYLNEENENSLGFDALLAFYQDFWGVIGWWLRASR